MLSHRDLENCLILIDMEVAWPPAPTMERIGAYEWLGGPIEAALLIVRALGGILGVQWAAEEGTRLLSTPREYRDIDNVLWRAYHSIRGGESQPRDRGVVGRVSQLSWNDFTNAVTTAGRNMEHMDHCARDVNPLYFEGRTLLVLAPEFLAAWKSKLVFGELPQRGRGVDNFRRVGG